MLKGYIHELDEDPIAFSIRKERVQSGRLKNTGTVC